MSDRRMVCASVSDGVCGVRTKFRSFGGGDVCTCVSRTTYRSRQRCRRAGRHIAVGRWPFGAKRQPSVDGGGDSPARHNFLIIIRCSDRSLTLCLPVFERSESPFAVAKSRSGTLRACSRIRASCASCGPGTHICVDLSAELMCVLYKCSGAPRARMRARGITQVANIRYNDAQRMSRHKSQHTHSSSTVRRTSSSDDSLARSLIKRATHATFDFICCIRNL